METFYVAKVSNINLCEWQMGLMSGVVGGLVIDVLP